MAKVRSAIMRSATARRITTTAGHVMVFAPGEERQVPAMMVPFCLRYGCELVKEVGPEVEMPESRDKQKMPELIKADSSLIEDKKDLNDFDDEVLERIKASSDQEESEVTENAIRKMDNFNRHEARIKDAILEVLTSGDSEAVVASTGRPKTNILSTKLGGRPVTAATRDLVWNKMESAGLLEGYES